MYIRAQFTGRAFKDLLRFRTSSLTRPCPQLYFEAPRLMLTRIEFIEFGELFAAPARDVSYPNNGPQEQVFQKHRLGLKLKFRVSSATLNAANDPVPAAQREGLVNVAIDLIIRNGKDYISIEVLETDFDQVLGLVGVGKQELSNLLSAQQMELGIVEHFNDVGPQIGGMLTLRHADLGFDVAADRVELRLECQSPPSPPTATAASDWRQFYANTLDSITDNAAWAFLVDQRIGTQVLSRAITAAVDATGKFSRDGGVTVNWEPNVPGYHASVEGEVIDACWCVWDEIDLDMRFWADTRISLNSGRIRIDVSVDNKITDVAEAACCVLTAAVAWPLVGLDLAINKKSIAWYEYLVGLALYPSPLLMLVGVIAVLASKLGKGMPFEVCTKDGDNQFHCEVPIPELSATTSCQGAKVTVRAESVTGRSDGLVLGGRIDTPPIVDPGIGVDVSPLEYQPVALSCSGGIQRPEQYTAKLRVFRTSGNYDFRVCRVHVLGPFKYAAKVDIEDMTCPYTAWVTISIGVTQYDGKALKVIISTTHGAVHTVIPAGRMVSEEERERASLSAQLERVSRCYAKSKRWDIRWVVDPEPYSDVVRTRAIWTLVGISASEATRVDILHEAAGPLASIDTTAGRAFNVGFVQSTGMISVVQEIGRDTERLEDAELHVVQALAGVEQAFQFNTAVLSVDAVRMSPVGLVIVHEREQLTLLEVGERGQMLRLNSIDVRGADWVARIGKTLFAHFEDGRTLRLLLAHGNVGFRAARDPATTIDHDCGCGSAKSSALWKPPVSSGDCLPLDVDGFDHHITTDLRHDDSDSPVQIRNGYWREWVDGMRVTRRLDRPRQHAAVTRLTARARCPLIRLRNGVLLTVPEARDSVELLRVLSRQEM